jgi:hypothetical protein
MILSKIGVDKLQQIGYGVLIGRAIRSSPASEGNKMINFVKNFALYSLVTLVCFSGSIGFIAWSHNNLHNMQLEACKGDNGAWCKSVRGA